MIDLTIHLEISNTTEVIKLFRKMTGEIKRINELVVELKYLYFEKKIDFI